MEIDNVTKEEDEDEGQQPGSAMGMSDRVQ